MKAPADASGWIAGELPEDGSIRRLDEDRYEVRIERLIPRPIETVWAALTIPERLNDWLGRRAELDLRVGGRYVVWFHGAANDGVQGVITEYDPPRVLAYDWNDSAGDINIRWVLRSDGDGCRLTFTSSCLAVSQPGIGALWFLGGAAGWHVFLDDFCSSIVNQARATHDGAYYHAVDARYRRHFGRFVPGCDTPPILRHHEPDGFVTPAGDGLYNLRFARRMLLPIEKVWAALTETDRLAEWFAQTSLDLRVGGTVEFLWQTQGHVDRGVIVALEAPRLIAWALPGPEGRHSVVRCELSQEDPKMLGTRLVLTQTFICAEDLVDIAAGWHAHLYDLADAAARASPLPWTSERERARAKAELAHVPRYRTRLSRGPTRFPPAFEAPRPNLAKALN